MTVCIVSECLREDIKGHGLCRMHHKRWWKYGTTDDPLGGRLDFRREAHPVTLEERFWQKVEPEPTTGCWLWIGGWSHGYGRLGHQPAHRFSYELHVGPVPEGLELDHLCHTPACVNPAHLEAVPHRENTRRHFARQTHCRRGHELSGANLYVRKNGTRACQTCRKALKRAWDLRQKVPA